VISGYEVVEVPMVVSGGVGSSNSASASCPAGKRPMGGGASYSSDVDLVASYVSGGGWRVHTRNGKTINNPVTLTVYAVCVTAQ
jgi:hypothetical protein